MEPSTSTDTFGLSGETDWEAPSTGKGDLRKGDVYRWEDDLTDEDGSRAGRSVIRATVQANATISCEGWLKVRERGRILVEGELKFPGGEVSDGELVVTGGTHDFRNASGSVVVTVINPKRYDVTVIFG
jgi:hypothetical protein